MTSTDPDGSAQWREVRRGDHLRGLSEHVEHVYHTELRRAAFPGFNVMKDEFHLLTSEGARAAA